MRRPLRELVLTGSNSINGTANSAGCYLIGNSSHNMLTGGAGNDTRMGGAGNDKYAFERGDDKDLIAETGGTDKLTFALTGGATGSAGGRIDYHQLWFERDGDSLDITVMGSADEVRIHDWFLGSAHQLETLEAGSGSEGASLKLLSADVQQLGNAMAAMARRPTPPAGRFPRAGPLRSSALRWWGCGRHRPG